MMQRPTSVLDDPQYPGYAKVSFVDGSSVRVPRDRALALLGPNSGALAQNMTPNPVASFQPPEAERPAPPQNVTDAAAPPIQSATPAAAVSPPPPERRQQVADPLDPRTGLRLSEYREAARPVYVPGTPGFDPNRVKASQVLVPVQRTTQVQQGRPYDAEAVADWQRKELEAKQYEAHAQLLDAENRVKTGQLTAQTLAEIEQKQRSEQAAREAAYSDRMNVLTQEARQIAQTPIDTEAYGKSLSGWQTIGLALAAGLTGYATRGGPNQILAMIGDKISQNIHAQEVQLRNRQDANRSELGRLAQEWGSLEAGRAALKVREVETAKAKLEATALSMGLPVESAKVQGMMSALDAIQAKERDQLKQAALGTTTTSEAGQFLTPRKATAGYYRQPTDKEFESRIDKTQGRVAKGQEIIGKNLDNQGTEAELLGVKPTKEQAAEQQQVAQRQEHLGKGLSEIANLRTNVNQILSRGGITEDKEGNAHHHGIPGVGMGYNVLSRVPFFGDQLADLAASTVGGKDALTIRQQAEEALTYKIKEASGAAFSQAEAERHAKALGKAFVAGEDSFAQALVNFNRALDEKEQSLRAGAGMAASRSYDADKAKLREESDAAKAGIRGTYRGTVGEQ
jgi:hypothetical protein